MTTKVKVAHVRLCFKSYGALNARLLDRCAADAGRQPHPALRDKTIWQVFEDERPSLVACRGQSRI